MPSPLDTIRADTAPIAIVGRDDERGALRSALAAPRPRIVVVEGEAGIGKSTLWREAIHDARLAGWHVRTSVPAAGEVRLSFSVLGDLLADESEIIATLPDPQREALEVALLRRAPATLEPLNERAIASGALGVLRERAREAPVLVAIDDAQWIDPASAGVLTFALRRLVEADVVVLLARRTPHPVAIAIDAMRVPVEEIVLGPLALGGLQRLLKSRVGMTFPRPTLRRIADVSRGNPFHALELASALAVSPALPQHGALPVPEDVVVLMRERCARLPEQSRSALVLLAAAGELPAPEDPSALQPAIEAGIVERARDRLRFAHPLLAAAVYAEASEAARRAAHGRLARTAATGEERARHLAAAAVAPDPATAGVLEQAAAEAAARGALHTTAELLERGTELTGADDQIARARRGVGAASAFHRAGDVRRAVAIARRLIAELPPGGARAAALAWLADAEYSVELADRALAECGDDERLRARSLVARSEAHEVNDEIEDAFADARAAVESATAAGEDLIRLRALAHVGFLGAMLGVPGSDEVLAAAAAEERPNAETILYGPTTALGIVRMWRDELGEARVLLERQDALATELGNDSARAQILERLARVDTRAGRWDRALARIDESAAMKEGAGIRKAAIALTFRSLVESLRGDVAAALADAEESLAQLRRDDPDGVHPHTRHALGFAKLQAGRYAEAAEELAGLSAALGRSGVREPGMVAHTPDELEALVLAGRHDDARERIAAAAARAEELDRPRELVGALRARGLLADAEGRRDEAIADLRAAQAECARLEVPFERARTLLVLGSLLRRAQRRREARDALAEALAIAEGLGARLVAERASSEIASIAGRASTSDALTASERRVAELVAEGRSTKEVAAALFLSPKTVEGHISRIYAKLGARSRVELARKLSA